MGILHRTQYRTTVDAIQVGTTLRYHWRDGDGLATVVEKTEEYVSFHGPDCNGRFSHEQIDDLIDDGRLQAVLDDVRHDERTRSSE